MALIEVCKDIFRDTDDLVQAAEESSVVAPSGEVKTKGRGKKHREFPEYIGKPLRDLVREKYPRKVGDTYSCGVSGCPHHYTMFSRDYCLCDTSHGKCLDCWNQLYAGYHKEG